MRRAAEARSRSVQIHLPTLKGKIAHRREVHEQASAQRVLRGRIIPSHADVGDGDVSFVDDPTPTPARLQL